MAHCIVPKLVRSASCVGMGLLLLVVLQAGCKRSTTVVGPKGEKATVTRNNDNMEVAFKGSNGEEVHFAGGKKDVALPADFPSDVAIYPKAMVALTTTANQVMSIMLKTADSPENAKTFYDKEMKKSGWKIANTMAMPAGTVVQGTKDGRTLTVFISKESDQTAIQLTVTKKAK